MYNIQQTVALFDVKLLLAVRFQYVGAVRSHIRFLCFVQTLKGHIYRKDVVVIVVVSKNHITKSCTK